MNPFEKRATEFIRDDVAYLDHITPEPLLTFLQNKAEDDTLFDRLAVIVGTPGSGKTTMARLFTLPTLATLIQARGIGQRQSIIDAMIKCGALSSDELPRRLAVRVALESDFRECWELPYEDDVKNQLLQSLLQARSILGICRALDKAKIDLNSVELHAVTSGAALEAIGGPSIEGARKRAEEVEKAVYRVIASLIPPHIESLDEIATSPYRPFDVLEAITATIGGHRITMSPLVICDDAHVLSRNQFDSLLRWLSRREIRISRWVMTRLDSLLPHEVLQSDSREGLDPSREITFIRMQSSDGRANQRKQFRRMAQQMSDRYLEHMAVFRRRQLLHFNAMVDCPAPAMSESKIHEIAYKNQRREPQRVGATWAKKIDDMAGTYLEKFNARTKNNIGDEMRHAMVGILLHRHLNRVPMRSLFEDQEDDVAPSKPVKASSDVMRGAEYALMHSINRPYYYGFNQLCDAACENAESFLRLAAPLVDVLQTEVMRNRDPILKAQVQHKVLVQRAEQLYRGADIPEGTRVRLMADAIARECRDKSLEESAPLGAGANAWGIEQSEFDSIVKKLPDIARVLHFGVAYNIFTLVRDYKTKHKTWCLIEVSGVAALAHRITLKRGGFLERELKDLETIFDNDSRAEIAGAH